MCQISERKNGSAYYFTTDTSSVNGERRTGSVDGATPVSSRRTFQQDCRNYGSWRIKKKKKIQYAIPPPPFFWHSVDRVSWYICVIRTNKVHFFLLIYFNNHPLYVSKLFIIRRSLTVYAAQSECRSTLIVLAASQRGCMINTVWCIYSKLPPDDV